MLWGVNTEAVEELVVQGSLQGRKYAACLSICFSRHPSKGLTV